jgi:hypothetical protein
MTRPPEVILVLAGLPGQYTRDGWKAADEVRHQLAALGFDASAQQVAAWLGRLCREELPLFERRDADRWLPWREYRVTPYGQTLLENRFPNVRVCA